MNKTELQFALAQLGFLLRGYGARLGLTQGLWQRYSQTISHSIAANPWFSKKTIEQALAAISQDMLQPDKFAEWLRQYQFSFGQPRKIGIIAAGNIPLVCFHDLLCVICSGNTAVVKLSHRDQFLPPFISYLLEMIDHRMAGKIIFMQELNCGEIEAVIGAGGNEAQALFEEKYSALPHIFRGAKISAAVLTGSESGEDLKGLARDILDYCGLGCRSVSKLFVPCGYNFEPLQKVLSEYEVENEYYAEALRYCRALFLAGGREIIDCQNVILCSQNENTSAAAHIQYEFYGCGQELSEKLHSVKESLQCLAAMRPTENFLRLHVPFGMTQRPQLQDYADGIDTIQWLLRAFV